MCDEKWILHSNCYEWLSDWTKKKLQTTSQSQTCTLKRSWSLFVGLLPVWSTTAFWILAKPLYQRHMRNKLMETESVNLWDMYNSGWPHRPKPARLLCPWGFSKKDYWIGWPFPSPGIFQTQGSNLSLLIAGRFFTTWAPRETQQIDEMHWKLQHLQLALVNRKCPSLHDKAWPHMEQPTLQKLKELGYEVWPHLPYSPDLLPTNYHFFKHLDNSLQWRFFQNHQEAENAFQEFVNSKTQFLCSGNKQTYFVWQKFVNCNYSYFD